MATQYAVKSGSAQHRQNTRDAIVNRESFTTGGALHGERWSEGAGSLSGDARRAFYVDIVRIIHYIVYSYQTPIAWFTDDGWTVVADHFSPTTTVHQGVVKIALAEAGYEYREVGS